MAIEVASLPDLEALHVLLMRENMAHSPEIWLHIHQLLANRAAQGALPKTAETFAHLLGPLVCKSPQHQYRIVAVMQEWLSGQKPTVQAQITSPEQPAAIAWKQGLQQFNRRTMYGVAAMLLLLLSLVLALYFYSPQPVVSDNQRPVKIEKPIASSTAVPETSNVPITDWIAPNPLPMPEQLPPNWQRWQKIIGQGLPVLPAIIGLVALVWLYRKRTVLRNKAPQGEKLLKNITFDLAKDNVITPFSGADFIKAAAKLLHPIWVTSRRLHIANSVIATAQNSGFFTPHYRQRHERPEYLILVQSVHGDDQIAGYAELLVKALQQQKVDVRSYRFRDDPRRLIPKIQPLHGADTVPLSLMQLAQKHSDARLIVISDWNILFQPYYPDRQQDWVKQFDNWVKRVWLSPGYEDEQWAARAAKQAQQLNFCLLPLASDNILDMVRWLQQEGERPAPLGQTGDEKEHLPAILSMTADSWLDWRPPHGVDLKQLCQELQHWLGQDGFLLLQALAVFPKPVAPLPQILDIQLFSVDSKPSRFLKPGGFLDESQQRLEREKRLQRISRLPWLRFAYMPDYLRIRLLKSLNRQQRKQIREAWAAILQGLTSEDNVEKISVPISLPKTGQLKIRNLLKAQPHNSAINDPIFANILLGGRLGLLDFSLPQALAKIFPRTDKWLDVRPALAVLVLAGSSVWGVDKLWNAYGQDWLINHWQQQLEQQNAAWQVEISSETNTEELAKVLTSTLQGKKFNLKPPVVSNTAPIQQTQPEAKKDGYNQIRYAKGGETQAAQVAQTLAWLSYNAPVEQIPDNDLPQNTLQVQLSQTYQHQTGFTDELRLPYVKKDTIVDKKIDDKNVVILEPEMVKIPAGIFLMGSPADEKDSFDNEKPQHQVTIPQPFAIGKYEVTFAEYDVFAKATNRKLPNDEGWGRDKRPVVNVSFEDAQAYVEWLSQQTGKAYRLPTEAEWEYATRAGTTTAYSWGNDIDCSKANYGYSSKDCKMNKTQPVGSYSANPWGLHDMAGNVFEWTSDCWHDNYKFAPTDGFAWLKEQNGDCSRRVSRGGSWVDDQRSLRSANRYGSSTDGAYGDLGFRVARAL